MRSALAKVGTWLLSGLAGVATAIVFSFMLYRMGLPVKPFIYVVF